MRRIVPWALVAALSVVAGSRAEARVTLEDRLHVVDTALARWDLVTASWNARAALAEAPRDPQALLAAARVAFHEADYKTARARAQAAAKAAGEGTDAAAEAGAFVAYLAEREGTWSKFSEHGSDNFVLRVTPGDEILVPAALAALESSAREVGAVLDYCPDRPVVVEVYPNRRSFIAASTLSREEVETSGTVAICHFNRVMIMSPAVMARGYDWLDTLCHEFVHHAVYHVGEDAIPVWLHEGIAKSLQGRWRSLTAPLLEPHSSTLLAEALESGTWVTFEEMHPSMAKLPSSSLVGLAFAEVAVAVSTIIEDAAGPAKLRSLLAAIRDTNGDLDAALQGTLGLTFGELETRTRERARSMKLYRIPGARFLAGDAPDPEAPVFTDEGEGAPDPEEEARSLADRKARDWTLIGDRLKGRQAYAAAVIEYDKALERLGHSEPLVVNRKAHAMILEGRLEEALAVLEEIRRDYPSLTTTLDNVCEIRLRLSSSARDPATREAHLAEALEACRESEAVNPFSTDAHLRLATILDRLGRPAEAEVSRERLAQLRDRGRE